MDEVSQWQAEHEQGRRDCGEDQLQTEQTVDLTQEIHPDLHRGRCDACAVVKVIFDGGARIFVTAHGPGAEPQL